MGVLECRLNDEDQDSEDEELNKQLLFSQFNHLQQFNLHDLNYLYRLNNFANINNLNNLNNLNTNNNSPSSTALANQTPLNCPPTVESLTTSDEYLNYLTFLKNSWLNRFNQANLAANTAAAFNSSELKATNAIRQYQMDSTTISSNEQPQQTDNQEKSDLMDTKPDTKAKDDDEWEMVDVESDSNKNCLIEDKVVGDDFETLEKEISNLRKQKFDVDSLLESEKKSS